MLKEFSLIDAELYNKIITTFRFSLYQQAGFEDVRNGLQFYEYMSEVCDHGKYLVQFDSAGIEVIRMRDLTKISVQFIEYRHICAKVIVVMDVLFILTIEPSSSHYYLSLMSIDLQLFHQKLTKQVIKISEETLLYWKEGKTMMIQIANFFQQLFLCIVNPLEMYQIQGFKLPKLYHQCVISVYALKLGFDCVFLDQIKWKINEENLLKLLTQKVKWNRVVPSNEMMLYYWITKHRIYHLQLTISKQSDRFKLVYRENSLCQKLIPQFLEYTNPLSIKCCSSVVDTIQVVKKIKKSSKIVSRKVLIVIYEDNNKCMLVLYHDSTFNASLNDQYYQETSTILFHVRPIKQIILSSIFSGGHHRDMLVLDYSEFSELTLSLQVNLDNVFEQLFPDQPIPLTKFINKTNLTFSLIPQYNLQSTKTNVQQCLCVIKLEKNRLQLSWINQQILFPKLTLDLKYAQKFPIFQQNSDTTFLSACQSELSSDLMQALDTDKDSCIDEMNQKYNLKDQLKNFYCTLEGSFSIQSYLLHQGFSQIKLILYKVFDRFPFKQFEQMLPIEIEVFKSILQEIKSVGNIVMGEIWSDDESNDYNYRLSAACEYDECLLLRGYITKNRIIQIFKKQWQNTRKTDRVERTVEAIRTLFNPKKLRQIIESLNNRFGLMKEIELFLFSEKKYQVFQYHKKQHHQGIYIQKRVIGHEISLNDLITKEDAFIKKTGKLEEDKTLLQKIQAFLSIEKVVSLSQFLSFVAQIKAEMHKEKFKKEINLVKFKMIEILKSIYLGYEKTNVSLEELTKVGFISSYRNYLKECSIQESFSEKSYLDLKNSSKIPSIDWGNSTRQEFIQLFSQIVEFQASIGHNSAIGTELKYLIEAHHLGVRKKAGYARKQVPKVLFYHRKQFKKSEIRKYFQQIAYYHLFGLSKIQKQQHLS